MMTFQEVTVNGVLVNLASSDLSPTVIPGDGALTTFPKPGCDEHDQCRPTYCSNHGNCIDLWTQNRCDCRPGFVGEQCSWQTMSHFSGHSFMHFEGQADVTDISLWISTTGESGIILYTVSIAQLWSLIAWCSN